MEMSVALSYLKVILALFQTPEALVVNLADEANLPANIVRDILLKLEDKGYLVTFGLKYRLSNDPAKQKELRTWIVNEITDAYITSEAAFALNRMFSSQKPNT
jgi:hypothetical protein